MKVPSFLTGFLLGFLLGAMVFGGISMCIHYRRPPAPKLQAHENGSNIFGIPSR